MRRRDKTYIKDAERDGDDVLATFFGKAQSETRKGAEEGKALLRAARLRRTPSAGGRSRRRPPVLRHACGEACAMGVGSPQRLKLPLAARIAERRAR